MLTDKNILLKNKVIECKTYACETKIIKQGCQTEVNFEGEGVKERTWNQQQLVFILKKDTFIFKKGIFYVEKVALLSVKCTIWWDFIKLKILNQKPYLLVLKMPWFEWA